MKLHYNKTTNAYFRKYENEKLNDLIYAEVNSTYYSRKQLISNRFFFLLKLTLNLDEKKIKFNIHNN